MLNDYIEKKKTTLSCYASLLLIPWTVLDALREFINNFMCEFSEAGGSLFEKN